MIKGEVKVSNWEPDLTGYLEMWSHLPAKKGGSEIASSFFSRTKSPAGPLKILEHDDDQWRPFILPANINDGSGRKPLRLDLNVILEGTRDSDALKQPRVQLRNIHFVQEAPAEIFADLNKVESEPEEAIAVTPVEDRNTALNQPVEKIRRPLFSWFSFILGFLTAAVLVVIVFFIRHRLAKSGLQRIREIDSI